MDPLIVLLVAYAAFQFWHLPHEIMSTDAAQRAGYSVSAFRHFVNFIFAAVILVAWWVYAVNTGVILLGIIPTVSYGIAIAFGFAWGVVKEIV